MGWPEANAVIAPARDEENEETVAGETGGVEMDAYGFPMTNSRAPATRGSNIQQLRQGVQDSLVTQNKGITSLQDLVDKYGATENPGEGMDLSPLLAYADSVNGTDIAKSYKKPLTAQEKIANMVKLQSTVNNERQPLTADLQRGLSTDESAESKYYQQLSKAAAQGNKAETDLHKALFLSDRGQPTQVKEALGKLGRGVAYANLVGAIPEGKPTSNEMSTMSTNLTNLVSNSNVSSDYRLQEVVPHSGALKLADVISWFTAEPHGVEQTAWLERQKNEVAAEVRGAAQIVNGWQDQQYASLSPNVDPEKGRIHYKASKEWIKSAYLDQIPFLNDETLATKAKYPKGTVFKYSKDGKKTKVFVPGDTEGKEVNGIIR